MNSLNDILKSSFDYYDRNKEMYKRLLQKIGAYYISISTIDDKEFIYIYDIKKKLLFSSSFEFLSIYSVKNNILIWAWSNPYLQKHMISKSFKMLQYAINLDTKYHLQFKSELIISRYKIENPIQLDTHIALSSYITKSPFIIPYSTDNPENVGNIMYHKLFFDKDKTENIYYAIIDDHIEILDKFK